jgi:hypothetical protein
LINISERERERGECISDDIIHSQPGLAVSKHIQGGQYHLHTHVKKDKNIQNKSI